MTDLNEEGKQKIEEAAVKIYKAAYNKGLRVGAYTVSKIVLNMLNDKSKPLLTRIEKVRKYCKTPIDNSDKVFEETNVFEENGDSGNKEKEDINNSEGDTVEETES